MQRTILTKFIAVPLGIALLLAGLFFDEGLARSAPQAGATPTPDRLAEPTLPASPSQADHGAQVYWLSCLPCHGDRGQGLTDEFRQTYPPEEQYCWERGCHGEVPYESGFTIPTQIPGLIGATTLGKFANAAQLNSYVRATMPFWKPGSLSEEESWRVTAFILRENGLWDDSRELDAANAAEVGIPRATPTPVPAAALTGSRGSLWVAGMGAVLLISFMFYVLKKSRNTTTIWREDS